MHLLVFFFLVFFVFVSVLLFAIARKSHIVMAQASRNLTCGLMRIYMEKTKKKNIRIGLTISFSSQEKLLHSSGNISVL